jgi:hypothetical protein
MTQPVRWLHVERIPHSPQRCTKCPLPRPDRLNVETLTARGARSPRRAARSKRCAPIVFDVLAQRAPLRFTAHPLHQRDTTLRV